MIIVISRAFKSAYVSPSISIEALGANRSLTAVEAGIVMGQAPITSLTMILYGLLLKHRVTVLEREPLLKLKEIEKMAGDTLARAESLNFRYREVST